MGTRGAFGVIIGEKEKIAYNHMDSYPDGKGVEVLRWLRESIADGELENLRALAEAARVVDEDEKPTDEDKERLKRYTNLNVSKQDDDDWYCLVRELQGDLGGMLNAGYILDGSDFPLDSTFCEWAYIVDFDANVLEVYAGFQDAPPKAGRWAGRPTPEEWAVTYAEHVKWCKKNGREPWEDPKRPKQYAIELVVSYPFDALPSDEEFLGYFRLESGRAMLSWAAKYPDDLARLVVEIEDENLATEGLFSEEWQTLYDAALTKISPSRVARVRARA